MSEIKTTPEMLVLRVRQGDSAAYRQLLLHTGELLRPLLSRAFRHNADQDDVLQEILISVHKALLTYDPTRPYRPWVMAIARFRLNDHWRKIYGDELRHGVDLDEVEKNLAAPVTERAGAHEYLNDSLKLLPPRQAQILRLIHEEGFTAKEAGQKLGMNESAVKVAAHRAYKWLRARLEAP